MKPQILVVNISSDHDADKDIKELNRCIKTGNMSVKEGNKSVLLEDIFLYLSNPDDEPLPYDYMSQIIFV